MASKNVTQVLIGGKIYTLSGYESEEYLQRVAAYLNGKITEIKTLEGYARMTAEMKSLLLNLNTADDYFKLKSQADQLGEQISAKDRELYEIKHELITAQMKLEKMQREIDTAHANEEAAVKRAAALESERAGASVSSASQELPPVSEEAAQVQMESLFPEELPADTDEEKDDENLKDADELPDGQDEVDPSDPPATEGEEEITLPDPFHDGGASYAQAHQMSLDLGTDQKLSEPRPLKSTPRKKRKRR